MALGLPCFNCLRCLDLEQEKPFALCTICKSRIYCGYDCQSKDWAEHKGECRSVRDTCGPMPERYKTFFAACEGPLEEDSVIAEWLFHVRVDKPHTSGLQTMCPVPTWAEAYQVCRKQLEDERAIAAFESWFRIHLDALFRGFKHFRAPMADGHVVTLEIIRERYPTVAALLRHNFQATFYTVEIASPVEGKDDLVSIVRSSPTLMLEIHDMIGSFATMEEANDIARAELRLWKMNVQKTVGAQLYVDERNGAVAGMVLIECGHRVGLSIHVRCR